MKWKTNNSKAPFLVLFLAATTPALAEDTNRMLEIKSKIQELQNNIYNECRNLAKAAEIPCDPDHGHHCLKILQEKTNVPSSCFTGK